MGTLGQDRMSFATHFVRGILVAPRPDKLLRTLPHRKKPSRQGQHTPVSPSRSARIFRPRNGSMPGAIGWSAQVLSRRGGIRVRQQFQMSGFYLAGFLCLMLAVL